MRKHRTTERPPLRAAFGVVPRLGGVVAAAALILGGWTSAPAPHQTTTVRPASSQTAVDAGHRAPAHHHKGSTRRASIAQIRTTRSAMPWEGLPGYPAPAWDGSVRSLDLFIHLSGLLIGAALLLGGFHRDRRRQSRGG